MTNIKHKNIIFSLIFLCSLLFLTNCGENENSLKNTEAKYFDLQKFIGIVVKETQSKNPLVKKVIIDEQNNTTSKELHIKNWDNELHFFLENNLNKPVLWGQYDVTKTEKEEVYISKKQNLHTQKFQVKHISPTEKNIEITYNDNNYLYHAQRTLILQTENNIVKNYQIKGSQTGIWIADRHYDIKGEVKN